MQSQPDSALQESHSDGSRYLQSHLQLGAASSLRFFGILGGALAARWTGLLEHREFFLILLALAVPTDLAAGVVGAYLRRVRK
jgi:hypothetical protein